MVEYLNVKNGRIAFHKTQGNGPGIVFLGGLKSDMTGTKAVYLEEWAKSQGRAFLRFDYSGHGQSSGKFIDGCIGDWASDAQEAIVKLTEGPQILVGSSMGGWISLLMCKRIPEKVYGLVGVAAAPDFTEDLMWNGFDEKQRADLTKQGFVALPSEYSDEPYIITKKMILDGRNQLVLREALPLNLPTRFLQGTADADVDLSVALRLMDHVSGDDIRLTLVKDVDHRFSTPECLSLIAQSVAEVSQT